MSEQVQAQSFSVRAAALRRAAVFVELGKPRILALVLVVTSIGFALASRGSTQASLAALLHTLLGTALVAAGANALNQFLEAKFDAQMLRTQDRPVPSGRLTRLECLAFGVVCGVSGLLYLAIQTNPLTFLVAGITIVSYVLLYTPLKRLSPMCVYVGAVPGALPPLIGWAAGAGSLDPQAWSLFAIIYFWQLPHFAAIAWQYREDYARGGYPMLAVVDSDGWRTNLHVVTHTVGLLVASLLPVWLGASGAVYALCAMIFGLAYFAFGVLFLIRKNATTARQHMLASLVYLPLLFGMLLLDRTLL